MFNPSEKQIQALANMENYAWITSNRTNFENYQEFQSYFELIQKKANKKSKFNKAVQDGKLDLNEVRNKIKEKKEQYYTNENTLRSYAIEYLNRYFPSKLQLRDQLNKKTKNREIISKVLKDVEKFIDEEKMVKNLVDQLSQRWKNISYISTKLYNKKFDGDLIKNAIDQLKSWGTLLKEYSLEEKIKYYKNKWSSKSSIFMKFYERGQDRDILNQILEKVFWEEWENEIIVNEIEKLRVKEMDNNKIIKKLLSKGFKYWDIKDNL